MAKPLPKVDLNFKQKQALLIITATAVHAGLTGNAVYPTPPIALTVLQTAIDNYQAALVSSIKGSKADTSAKNDARLALINILRVEGAYVNQVNQDLYNATPTPATVTTMRENIISSGFKIAKTNSPVQASKGVALPKIRKLISPSSGNLYLLVKNYTEAQRGKKVFQVQYRTSATTSPVAPAGDWVIATLTKRFINISGLQTGKQYDVQVAIIGGRNIKLNDQKTVNYTPIQQLIIT